MPAEETAAIRAFFAQNLGAFNQFRIVDQQGAAFAASEVLCLVKALRRQRAEGAAIAPFVTREESMGVVFDDGDAPLFRDRHDGIHLAGDAGIMHQDDGAGAFGR